MLAYFEIVIFYTISVSKQLDMEKIFDFNLSWFLFSKFIVRR
jgi:hypothetical protein